MIVWNQFLNDARVLKEAETLQSEGYQVTVHALQAQGITEECEVLASGIKVVRVPHGSLWGGCKKHRQSANDQRVVESLGPIRNLFVKSWALCVIARTRTHLGLLWQLLRSNPDVVHAHDVNTLPTAWLASVLRRVPLVYDAHEISTDREDYAGFRKLVGCVEKKLMPRAAGTITTTDIRARFFALAYGIPRPLVLQNRPRLTQAAKGDKIRQELGLNKPWQIVLYQGGLQQGRGLDRVVDAARQVDNVYFVFIGGGRLELPLKEQVAKLGLEQRVRFIDTVSLDDLPCYTASADIGVQPIENTCLNHFSTDSNKLFEYMMAGIPVVASSLPEIRKLVRKYDLGCLVKPGNTGELVSAIGKLVADDKLRQKFRKNALIASQQVNWEEQEGNLLSLYKKVLNRDRC